MDVSSDAKVPRNAGYHETQAEDDGGPEHRAPSSDLPSDVAEGPESDIDVQDVADKERKEQGTDYPLLEGWLGVQLA